MISLRRFATYTFSLTAATVFLAACDKAITDPTAARPTVEDLGASFDYKPGCVGNSGGSCDMSSRVLLDKAGNATLEVRSGNYDENTGKHQPDGTIQKVQYKHLDETGKQIAVYNEDANGSVFRKGLPKSFKPNHRVGLQVNIKDASGKKGTSVMRDDVGATYATDLDLSAATIFRLVNGQRQPLGTVGINESNTYTVDIANIKTVGGTASSTGILTLCAVSVDGRVQIPYFSAGFAYIGSAIQYVAPGQTVACSFTLKLSAGAHTITVTAIAQDLFFDGDVANNTATGTVNAAAATAPLAPPTSNIDVTVDPITMQVDGVTAGTATILRGKTGNYHALIRNPNTQYSVQVRCEVTVNGSPATFAAGFNPNAITIAPNGAADCAFNVPFPVLATASIVVNAVVLIPTDFNLTNNSRTVTTVALGNGKFANAANADVHATELRYFENGVLKEILQPQSASIARLALLVTGEQDVLGSFKLAGSVASAGTEFSKGTLSGTLRKGNDIQPFCLAGADTYQSVNNQTVSLRICAQPYAVLAGSPPMQEVYIEYTSASSGNVLAPAPVFGNSVVFNVKLEWTINGAPPTVVDSASAVIEMLLRESVSYPLDAEGRQVLKKTESGTQIVQSGM
jgi:hypothetical protein